MSNKRPLYIPIAGPALLETSLLNKGSAFSSEERDSFNLTGLLPHNIETIEEQSLRAYHQLRSFTNEMDKLESEMKEWKQQDEDVLSYALFPQVAVDFFKYRQAQQEKVDMTQADTKNGAYPV